MNYFAFCHVGPERSDREAKQAEEAEARVKAQLSAGAEDYVVLGSKDLLESEGNGSAEPRRVHNADKGDNGEPKVVELGEAEETDNEGGYFFSRLQPKGGRWNKSYGGSAVHTSEVSSNLQASGAVDVEDLPPSQRPQ